MRSNRRLLALVLTISLFAISGTGSAQTQAIVTGLTAIAYHPSGDFWAEGNSDGLITIRDKLSIRESFQAHDASVSAFSWNPHGVVLASAGSDNTVKLWDVERSTVLLTIGPLDASVFRLRWSPDGSLLGGVSFDGVAIWDRRGVQHFLQPSYGTAYDLAWDPNQRFVAITELTDALVIYDASSYRRLSTARTVNSSSIFRVVWTGSDELITASLLGEIARWLVSPEGVASHAGPVESFANFSIRSEFSDDQRYVAAVAGVEYDWLVVYDLVEQRLVLSRRQAGRIGNVNWQGRIGDLSWRPGTHELAVAPYLRALTHYSDPLPVVPSDIVVHSINVDQLATDFVEPVPTVQFRPGPEATAEARPPTPAPEETAEPVP